MVGIRTQESDKFLRFFELVQAKAGSMKKVFFLDCGEGHEFEEAGIEGENLSGWLIPNDIAKKFEQEFISKDSDLEDWEDFVAFVEWSRSGDDIVIDINKL